MSKKLFVILLVAVALVASAVVYADQATSKLSTPSAAKEKPEDKYGPGPVGNPFLGNPGIVTRAPLNEGFESGAIPASWKVYNEDGDSYQWETYNVYPHTGSYHARIHWHSSGYCDDWLVTPRLTVASGDSLIYWARAYSSSYLEEWEVYVDAGYTPSDFLTTGTLIGDESTTSTTYAKYAYDLNAFAGQDVYIAFRCISYDAFYLYLDDITGPELWVPVGPAIAFNTTDLEFGTVTLPGSADLPLVIYSIGGSDLTVSNVVSDNAHFTHDFPGATAIPPGDSLTVTVTFTPTADPEETGNLTITHDGTKATSIITMSGSGFSGLLAEDFMGTFPPTGWTTYELGSIGGGWAQGTPGYDDSYCAWHDDFSGGTWDDWLISPAINLPAKAVYELEFMQYVRYPTYLSIHSVMISAGSGIPPTDFVQLYEVPHGAGYLWEAIEDISLAAYAGQTVYLAFRYEGGYDADWSVDNVVVQEFVYVNEPPVIVHDPKGDTDDTTPTITAIITDVEAFTATAYYETATKAFTPVAMSLTGVLPNEYSCDLPVGANGTVNYYIVADDGIGGVATTDTYSFDICPVVGIEVAYDDGTVEDATVWNPGYLDGRFAVRFTPPAYPCTLNTLKMGILHGWPDTPHQQFAIEIYDDDGTGGLPGTMIYGPETTGSVGNVIGGLPPLSGPPYPLNWAQICIDPPLVISDGDFYVAKVQFVGNPTCEAIEIDNTTISGRSYQRDPTTLVWSAVSDANYMIRAYTSQVMTYGNLEGHVYELTKGPIAGAVVTAVGGMMTKADTTDVDGYYYIGGLISGNYDVTATATGYYPDTEEDVVIVEHMTTVQDFYLDAFGGGEVLLVDGDGSYFAPDAFTDVRSYFTDALTACGYTYDIFEKTVAGQDGPDYAMMAPYPVVVWFTGETWQYSQTLTANDEANLALYLDGGGKLFLSAQDYFYDRYTSAGAFSPGQFPYDYLGVTSTTQDLIWITDPDVGTATGYSGSVADGLFYDLHDPYTTTKEGKHPDGLCIDELVIAGDAVFSADSGIDHVDIGATQYEGTGWKTVFTTVDFAGLVDGTHTRAELMCAIMDYLLAPGAEMWLSNGKVDPTIGGQSTTFTYSVTYTQINDIPPTWAHVYIDGAAHGMIDPTGGAGPYSGGVVFTYDHVFSQHGDHDFFFHFGDGTHTDRLPASGELWGPMNGYFHWDFEADNGGFTPSGPFDDWQWGVPTSGPMAAHSGEKCWGTQLAGNYSNSSQSRLLTPVLDFTAGGTERLELKFWHWYDTEAGYTDYDGGNVKIITPETTFVIYPDLLQADDYETYSFHADNAWIPGEAGYCEHIGQWKEAIYEITSFFDVFTEIQIGFDFGSDPSVSYPGWYIDDVVIWGEPPLPIELAGFSATAGDEAVTLTWQTRSERNNLGFDVYRRVEDGEYAKVNAERIPGAGNSEAGRSYVWIDRGLVNGTTYYYQLAAVDFGGNITHHDLVVSATPTATLPTAFALSQNYPNPFNPNTEIKYQLPEDSRVMLKIYNVAGQEVLTLVDAELKAGYYTATWNARDARGQEVSAGIYFCTLQAGQFSQTTKMVLLK